MSKDYLVYQLRTLPAHVTGWMSKSLATSSLIHALGLGAGPSGTVAASAAIKWITKDGLGAFGRFLVRQWRKKPSPLLLDCRHCTVTEAWGFHRLAVGWEGFLMRTLAAGA